MGNKEGRNSKSNGLENYQLKEEVVPIEQDSLPESYPTLITHSIEKKIQAHTEPSQENEAKPSMIVSTVDVKRDELHDFEFNWIFCQDFHPIKQSSNPSLQNSELIQFHIYNSLLERLEPANYKGEIKDGKPHGMGTAIFLNGHVYKGLFSEGILWGYGKMHIHEGNDSIGTTITGVMRDVLKVGYFSYSYFGFPDREIKYYNKKGVEVNKPLGSKTQNQSFHNPTESSLKQYSYSLPFLSKTHCYTFYDLKGFSSDHWAPPGLIQLVFEISDFDDKGYLTIWEALAAASHLIYIGDNINTPLDKLSLKEKANLYQSVGERMDIWFNESIICPITGEPIKTKGFLACGHFFELEAISIWFKKQKTCPLCRRVSPSPRIQKFN